MVDKPDDPFARIEREMAEQSDRPPEGSPDGAGGEHVAPAPAAAPPLPSKWKAPGAPSSAWAYRDADGGLLRWTLRFSKADGEKDIRPATLWRRPNGSLCWRPAAEPGPRPLYGLDRLAARRNAPVLLVEGEKTADAAGTMFSDFVAITWPGGANAVAKADFSPLKGRQVIIWPDADDPGLKAGEAAKRAALAAGATTVAIVRPPAYLPKGWDLADELPIGLTAADVAGLIADTRAQASSDDVEWPMSIRMDAKVGLFYDETTKDGTVVPHWLCAPMEVLGEARTPEGQGWSVVVRFRDHDRRERTIIISRASLASGGGEARSALADAGLILDPSRGKMDRLSSALMRVKCSRRISLAHATGWCGDRFVLPGRTIGPAGSEDVLFTGSSPSLHFGAAGTIDGWRSEVAAIAVGNSASIYAISTAFAAPLLRLVGGEGGGSHFRGRSSTGKSTLLHMAGSVWGGSKGEQGFGHTWRSTANALESLALAHNDLLLCLDELAQIDPSEAGGAAYALANGQGKARQTSGGALRQRAEWQLYFLSSGETSLADHMASGPKGGRTAAGQELRLVDIPAEAGAGMGIWECLHGTAGPSQLSEAMKRATRAHYGHAGPMFLERLTADRDRTVAHARELVGGFIEAAATEGDSGQVRRVASRFAIVAAAGELAIAWGIVPWPAGTAAAAALTLYRRWADGFGRGAPREERDILRRLREVIQSERSAFSPLGDSDMDDDAKPSVAGRDGEARSLKTYGFRQVRGPEVKYLFHEYGWQYVFRGVDPVEAARTVLKAGFLEVSPDRKRLKKKFTIRGEHPWLYCVKASILEASFGD